MLNLNHCGPVWKISKEKPLWTSARLLSNLNFCLVPHISLISDSRKFDDVTVKLTCFKNILGLPITTQAMSNIAAYKEEMDIASLRRHDPLICVSPSFSLTHWEQETRNQSALKKWLSYVLYQSCVKVRISRTINWKNIEASLRGKTSTFFLSNLNPFLALIQNLSF